MNEIDALDQFRENTPAMSARAQVQGRRRLNEAITGERPGRRRGLLARRTLLLGAAAATLSVAVVAYGVVGQPGPDSTAAAATVLQRAAGAISPESGPAPRPGQFIYLDILRVTSGMKQRVQTWTAVDGSRPGLIRSDGFLGKDTSPVPPYQPEQGLHQAPYTVLSALPTDPTELVQILYADPHVRGQMRANNLSREVAVWDTLRSLVETAPPAQKAALFKAAAQIKGIVYVESATDAAGRTGEAVGLEDPRLGSVQFIFDRDSHEFLGERTMRRGSTTEVQFNATVQRTAVVDAAGRLPGE